jgi:hypothetical protein
MGASSWRLLDGAKSNTIDGFLQRCRNRSKKAAQSWRVSTGLSALAHEPAEQKHTPEKNQKKNLRKKNQCKPNNQ